MHTLFLRDEVFPSPGFDAYEIFFSHRRATSNKAKLDEWVSRAQWARSK